MIKLGGDRDSQTICAVSTPPGHGGISVIRASGALATSVIHRCVQNYPSQPESHKAYFGQFRNPTTQEEIDQVVVLYFAEGKSFTGEETVEISCHGSPVVCEQILKILIDQGLCPAQPGEFTYRAFMNNRLDLVQAESVLSLIESRSQKSSQIALRQLEGALSEEIESIEGDMTWCLAHIEAGIDFATEGLEITTQVELVSKLKSCLDRLQTLLSTYQKGKTIKEGVQVALIGRPNVGKSSLLNLLLGYDRAIVTAQAGTTRDVVEADIVFEGIRFVFQDTAGLRGQNETQDEIEKIGIRRTQEVAQKADLVLFCLDLVQGWGPDDESWLKNLKPQNMVFVANKTDQVNKDFDRNAFVKNLQIQTGYPNSTVLFVSALDKRCRQSLLDTVKKLCALDTQGEQVLLSHARHYENILKAKVFTEQGIEALENQVGPEFISIELKEALVALQETLGKRFDDQIMDRVFKEFCIGK